MAITMVKVRAKISIGGLTVETPFIRSFSVNKTRGQVSTFSATLKIPHTSLTSNLTGNSVVVEAGEGGPNIKVFTGMVKQAKISPCLDDPYYVDLSISGADALSHLQGKKFSRRCRSSRTAWVSINSVTRAGLKSGKFQYTEDSMIEITPGEPRQDDNVVRALKTIPTETLPKTAASMSILIKGSNIAVA